ncbi:MAG: ABC transporter permease subunit [Spirochaetaceae bacterium]|nr:ABC transporter permease subunit [Myxococcales bacterium]MCB9724474.1 ABC transporter permease subunit [Spirochaetaceae bacterium]HPG25188.1 ABC transporter permease [Myxococcota bacterium]
MRHTLTIASRELRSLFVSPVAYVVLTLWSVIAGTFFLASLIGFQEQQIQLQQYQMLDRLEQMNLNDQLIEPFIGSMWVIVLFLLPAVTMGLVASEKANGTEELLLTSPLSIWDIVLGKFLAGAGFVAVMTAIVAFFPALLFLYGEPEVGKTLSGLLSLLLVSITYVAVGVFGSSVTRNQLIAFVLTLVLLVVIGMMLPFIVDITMAGSGLGRDSAIAQVVAWMATGSHVDRMLQGLIDTSDLAYFVVSSGVFLLLSKTVIESARWR